MESSEHNDVRIRETAAIFANLADILDQTAHPLITASGLPGAQIRTLYTLHYQKEVTIGQLAEQLEVGLPTTSYHVERMVEAGLVERTENQSDRRSKLLRLTIKGQTLIDGFLQQPVAQVVIWLAQLPPGDLAMLQQGLKALAQIVTPDDAGGSGGAVADV